jgi:hypothetical protein
MRYGDLVRLNEPYGDGFEPTDADARAALGLKLPRWTTLDEEIHGDIVEQDPYGVGWWAPEPGTSRRILISDQLYCCLTSVVSNMIEAALHSLEYLEAADRDDERLADAVKMGPGGPTICLPRPRTPYDQLCPHVLRLHQAGLIRSLASALDCLAGVMIGVVPLPQNILKADFKKARTALGKIDRTANAGTAMQAQFATQLEAAIAGAGPPGWLDWTLDFRNMLVHRGRRIEHGQFLPIEPVLYGPDGRPAPRARRAAQLPRDPGRSDVEVFIDTPWEHVLPEEARKTLFGLTGSTISLLETVAQDLLALWQWRRAHPGHLRQPASQWKRGPSKESTGFNGYAPGSLKLDPCMGIMHPVTARRFYAAALDDQARPQWNTFD